MNKYRSPLLALTWLAAVGYGLGALAVYEHTPGEGAGAPGRWPAQSHIPQARGRPTLIMFAHPRCPCTRASIGELAALMTHCQGAANCCVVFYRPAGTSEDWARTDLWRSAEAIPGVTVRADEEGAEARRFKVTTSGHVVLYDVDGTLLFSGGITSSRGHYGDNAGRTALALMLHHEAADMAETPVFGCPLLGPKQECAATHASCTH